MAKCASCGQMILFGGIDSGGLKFCNRKCLERAKVLSAADAVPDEAIEHLARQIHAGPCPRCNGPGPVDVHVAYWVWSALAFTRWGNWRQVCCRRCAVKGQIGRLVTTGLFGWWGFPWGIVFTPVQFGRTVIAMFSPPKPAFPSAQLWQVARVYLASQPRPVTADATAAPEPEAEPVPETWEEWV